MPATDCYGAADKKVGEDWAQGGREENAFSILGLKTTVVRNNDIHSEQVRTKNSGDCRFSCIKFILHLLGVLIWSRG